MIAKHLLKIMNNPDLVGNGSNPFIFALRTGSDIGLIVAQAAIGNAILAQTPVRQTAAISDIQALQAAAVGSAIWSGIPYFLEACCCARRDDANQNNSDNESESTNIMEFDILTHVAWMIIDIETGAAVLQFVPNAQKATTSQYLAANGATGAAVLYVGLYALFYLVLAAAFILEASRSECKVPSLCDILERLMEGIRNCCAGLQQQCNPKPLLSMFNCCTRRKRESSNNATPLASTDAAATAHIPMAIPVDERAGPVQIIYVYREGPVPQTGTAIPTATDFIVPPSAPSLESLATIVTDTQVVKPAPEAASEGAKLQLV